MKYFDTHCHIDRYDAPLQVLQAAEKASVTTVIVTELPSAFQRLSLQLGRRKSVRVALGLHPLRAGNASPLEMALFTRHLDRTDYVGEIGLDRSRHGRDSFKKQVKVFEHLLDQPRIKNKVLTVHTRGAEQEAIERLAQAGTTAIIHWYSGALKHIDTALQAGLWFSVNPAMLRSENGKRIVAALPPERVVTETDGPHTKVNGRVSEPRDIPSVVSGLASAWNQTEPQVAERVLANLQTLEAMARRTAA